MFGSGDDKKTPQPAPRADTPETVEQAVSASAAKPVKKAYFLGLAKRLLSRKRQRLGLLSLA